MRSAVAIAGKQKTARQVRTALDSMLCLYTARSCNSFGFNALALESSRRISETVGLIVI